MSDFKMEIKIGEIGLKLEGEFNEVHKMLNEIKEDGIGKLNLYGDNIPSTQVEKAQPVKMIDSPQQVSASNNDVDVESEYPTLDDLAIRDVPKTEKEWVLIYAFYSSSYGKVSFTKNDITERYKETNRYTDNRSGNLSTNIKNNVKDKFFSAKNNTDYLITPSGIKEARKIIFEEIPVSKKSSNKKESIGQKSTKTFKQYKIIELGLDENERKSLSEFYFSYTLKSAMEKVTVLAFWLKKNKNIEEIGCDEIFTMLRTLDLTVDYDILSTLSNAKNKKNYFTEGAEKSKFKIFYIGEDMVNKLTKQSVNND